MENSTKIITVAKIEMTAYETSNQYKLTTTENQKFKFYDKKKDGTETVAFRQFKDMELKIGDTCEVWFKEIEKEYEGKSYTDRIIASFRETNAVPESRQTQNLPRGKEITYKAEKDTDWDEIAVGKCQTNFLAAYIQSGKSISDAKLQVIPARQLAELVVYGSQKSAIQALPEPPPAEISVDEIPF